MKNAAESNFVATIAALKRAEEAGADDRDVRRALRDVYRRVLDVMEGRVPAAIAPSVLKAGAMLADAIAGKQAERQEISGQVTLAALVQQSLSVRPGAPSLPAPSSPAPAVVEGETVLEAAPALPSASAPASAPAPAPARRGRKPAPPVVARGAEAAGVVVRRRGDGAGGLSSSRGAGGGGTPRKGDGAPGEGGGSTPASAHARAAPPPPPVISNGPPPLPPSREIPEGAPVDTTPAENPADILEGLL
jgi:hypothetical protein